MDVSSLSDSELRAALIAAGASVGPITGTTRRIFENKLRRLQNPKEDGEVPVAQQPVEAPPKEIPADVKPPDNQNNELPEPKSYFGVAIPPNDSSPQTGESFVFGARQDALKAVKANPGARFKEFVTKEEALKFASRPAVIQTPQVPPPKPIPGESSEFRGPKTPELSKFRRLIEKGELDVIQECVWSNPRYLISGGDSPVILQEGCRYNALHVCAMKNQPAAAMLILETLEDAAFMARLYPQDAESARGDRIHHMLDLYLNMPDKGSCETPLHFACKFGHVEMVQVLLDHPLTNRLQPNGCGQTPEQVACTRIKDQVAATKKEIVKLIEATYFVPLLRPADKSRVATVGEPWLTTSSPASLRGGLPGSLSSSLAGSPVSRAGGQGRSDPIQSPLVVDACAGPMSPSQAQAFRKKWMAHTSVEDRRQFLSICCKDDEKGQERIGRMLAADQGVGWREYWEFLEEYVDLSTQEGLRLLEDYLEQRAYETNLTPPKYSENSTLCCDEEILQQTRNSLEGSPQSNPPMEAMEGVGGAQEDSFTETLGSLEDQFSALRIRSPSPLKPARSDMVENIGPIAVNPWKENLTKFADVNSNNNSESLSVNEGIDFESVGGRAMGPNPFAAPKCPVIPELNSALEELSLIKGALPIVRKKSDLESEGDFMSCGSVESDRSIDTFYTAAGSPPASPTPCITPPRPQPAVFLLGPEPTKMDSDVLHALDETVITPEFPNVSRWHRHVTAYSEEVRNKWSSPRRDRPWSTSQRNSTKSRLSDSTPGRTPGGTPSRTPGRTPKSPHIRALQAVRTNLMNAISDSDVIPPYI